MTKKNLKRKLISAVNSLVLVRIIWSLRKFVRFPDHYKQTLTYNFDQEEKTKKRSTRSNVKVLIFLFDFFNFQLNCDFFIVILEKYLCLLRIQLVLANIVGVGDLVLFGFRNSEKTLTKEMSVRFTCWDFRCFQSWRMKQSVYYVEIVDVFGLLSLNFFFFFVFIRNLRVCVFFSFICLLDVKGLILSCLVWYFDISIGFSF